MGSKKGIVYIGFIIGSGIGTFIGTVISGGNVFGVWAFSIGLACGLLGFFIASKFASN